MHQFETVFETCSVGERTGCAGGPDARAAARNGRLLRVFPLLLRAILLAALLAGVIGDGACAHRSGGTGEVATPLAHPVEGPLGEQVRRLSTDGTHYFGGFPTQAGLESLEAKGVRRVVSLKSDEEVRSRCGFGAEGYREAGLEVEFLPVGGWSLDDGQLDRFAELVVESDARGTPILIHCGSSNTVGFVWGLYLAKRRGVEPDRAFEAARAAGLRHEAGVAALRSALGLSPEAVAPIDQ